MMTHSVVAQLFTAIGIKRVVYVDDRFGITRERLSALCRGRTAEQIVASAVFPGIEADRRRGSPRTATDEGH